MALSARHDVRHKLNREGIRHSSVRTILGCACSTIFFFLACTKHAYHPELVTYLRQEKELRMRMATKRALDDSVAALQRYCNIDPEEEYRMLTDNPESWLALLKELSIAK